MMKMGKGLGTLEGIATPCSVNAKTWRACFRVEHVAICDMFRPPYWVRENRKSFKPHLAEPFWAPGACVLEKC